MKLAGGRDSRAAYETPVSHPLPSTFALLFARVADGPGVRPYRFAACTRRPRTFTVFYRVSDAALICRALPARLARDERPRRQSRHAPRDGGPLSKSIRQRKSAAGG